VRQRISASSKYLGRPRRETLRPGIMVISSSPELHQLHQTHVHRQSLQSGAEALGERSASAQTCILKCALFSQWTPPSPLNFPYAPNF
jgi:hypothetical protein